LNLTIREFSSSSDDFRSELDSLLAWDSVSDARVQKTVADIVEQVRLKGDDAVIEFTNRFDRPHLNWKYRVKSLLLLKAGSALSWWLA
jgi:histidinol dehydrogenase